MDDALINILVCVFGAHMYAFLLGVHLGEDWLGSRQCRAGVGSWELAVTWSGICKIFPRSDLAFPCIPVALEVISVYCICMVGMLHSSGISLVSSQLQIQWHPSMLAA